MISITVEVFYNDGKPAKLTSFHGFSSMVKALVAKYLVGLDLDTVTQVLIKRI